MRYIIHLEPVLPIRMQASEVPSIPVFVILGHSGSGNGSRRPFKRLAGARPNNEIGLIGLIVACPGAKKDPRVVREGFCKIRSIPGTLSICVD